jgi:hypothetical protein
MNTETRRHEEKSAYRRKGKYRENFLDDEELGMTDDEDDRGVLGTFAEEPEAQDDSENDDSGRPGNKR